MRRMAFLCGLLATCSMLCASIRCSAAWELVTRNEIRRESTAHHNRAAPAAWRCWAGIRRASSRVWQPRRSRDGRADHFQIVFLRERFQRLSVLTLTFLERLFKSPWCHADQQHARLCPNVLEGVWRPSMLPVYKEMHHVWVVLNCTVDRTLIYLKGGVAWEGSNFSVGNSITGGGMSLAANAATTPTLPVISANQLCFIQAEAAHKPVDC
jgi:hypothetical protein